MRESSHELEAIQTCVQFKLDNGNVHRAAAKINASKSRAARGSACNVLLSGRTPNPNGLLGVEFVEFHVDIGRWRFVKT